MARALTEPVDLNRRWNNRGTLRDSPMAASCNFFDVSVDGIRSDGSGRQELRERYEWLLAGKLRNGSLISNGLLFDGGCCRFWTASASRAWIRAYESMRLDQKVYNQLTFGDDWIYSNALKSIGHILNALNLYAIEFYS